MKSSRAKQHFEHFGEVLDIEKIPHEADTLKCVFGVSYEKFLGFVVSKRCIETNLEKRKALQDMESPTKEKEVQKLIGYVATLNRFISKAMDKCVPSFDIIRGNKHF